MISTSLVTPPPYSFSLTAAASRFLYVMGAVTPEATPSAETFRRVIRVGDALALVEWRDHPLYWDHVRATALAYSSALDPGAFARKAWRIIHGGAGAQLAKFYAHVDEPLVETVNELYGLTHFLADSMFEALALTIIEQQIALKLAQTAERWLLATYGDPITYDGVTYYAFPTPERIAKLTERDLKPLKITFGRMRLLISIAQQIVDGTLDLEALRHQPMEQAWAALLRLRGVGEWTAAWAMLRGTGAYPYLSSADVALRAAVNRYFFNASGRAPRADTDALFRRYGEHAGAAAYYVLTRYAFEKY